MARAHAQAITILLSHYCEGFWDGGGGATETLDKKWSFILHTVIESCRRRGIDPYAYLRDVLTRLPHLTNHQVHEVTPAVWAKAHLQVQRQATS